jgi:hypothetical protein
MKRELRLHPQLRRITFALQQPQFTGVPLGTTRATLLRGPTRTGFHWEGTGPAFEVPLTLELLLTVLELNWAELSWAELSWAELSWADVSWTELNSALLISLVFCCSFSSDLPYCVLAWIAKRLPFVIFAVTIVHSLPRKRESATSVLSSVAVLYPGHLPLSGYCETRHIMYVMYVPAYRLVPGPRLSPSYKPVVREKAVLVNTTSWCKRNWNNCTFPPFLIPVSMCFQQVKLWV